MVIYDINGNKIIDATLTSGAEHEEELGKSNLVRLSWQSDKKIVLHAGSYIIPFGDGLKYRLLNSYTPQENEKAFNYTPEFHHPLMWLSRVPFLYDTTDADKNPIKQQEWSFEGLTTSALEYTCKAINEALGIADESKQFTYTLCGNVDASVSFSVSANDILSVLSSIAQACRNNSCEWHLSLEHKALYFGQISINLGEEVPTLKAHDNVQVPNISESKENYYNSFYPQGSTKNMSTKALVGTGNVATLARLGLNKSDYPDGCIYVGTDGNVITKEAFEASGEIKQTLALSFDDVYPHIDLYVYNVRKHVRYLKNSQTNTIELDSRGNKKTYTIWYMRLAFPSTTQIAGKNAINITHDKNESGEIITHYWYDYEIERTKQVLQGYTLKGIFKVNTHAVDGKYNALTQGLVGQPNGQEGFELHYHETNQNIPESTSNGDSGVSILKGDYEIIKYQSGDTIIPTNESEGLYPRGNTLPDLTCNMVVLFNIVMGEHETKLAQEELAARTIKEIKRRAQDNNNYSFSSNAVAFANKNPKLYIGQKVTFDDGFGYQLKTRVLRLVTKLDYPIIQEITVGNQAVKGTISQLKEDVNNILSGNFSGGGLNATQTSELIKNYVDPRFLNKQTPDTAQELITFLKGLKLGNDYSINELGEAVLKAITSKDFNALEQAGFGITQRRDGKYQLSITDLIVWGKAVFNEIEKRKLSYVGGNFVFSACGSKIKKVEDKGNVWRCYFYQDDGSTATTNLWDVDDQARCQIFNIKAGVYQGVANRNYWRKVVAKGDDYIDLSKTDCEQGSDVPLSGDTLVQFGNRTKTDRQNIIEILTTGDEAPAIVWYAGVNSYSLEGKSTSVISPKKVEFDTNLFRLITRSGARVPLITDRGAWLATEEYGYYDRVSDNGRLWLCIAQGKEVTSRPGDNNPDWQLQVDKGANGTSEKTYIRYSDDNGATFTKEKPFVEETPLFEKADDIVSTNKSKTKPVGAYIANIPLAGFTTGAVYTLSLDYKFDEKAERAEVVIFSAKYKNKLQFKLDKSTDFSHSSFAFTLPDFSRDGNYFYARLDNTEAVTEGVDGSVLARNVRIEKGGVEYPNSIGRNLAKGTLDFSGVWNLSVSGVVTDEKYNGLSVLMQDGSWNQRGAVVSCKAGRVYTFSFFAKVDTEIPINCKWVLRNVEYEDYIATGGLTSYGQFTTEWKRYSVTIKFLRDCPNAAFSVEKKDNGSKMWLCGYKVEYGDKATEYSPAPEDLQFGLTTGKYIGISSWDKPYPPLNTNAYTWSEFKGEDGKDAEIYRLKASKESAKVTADGLLICDAAYTIEHVQGTSVEVITSEGAAGNKPYVSAHTDKGVSVSVTAGANNTILYKLNGYFDLASRPDNIIVELYVKVGGSAKIVDTRVIPILMEAMSYTRMVRDMRENISANGRDISTIRQTANSVSVKVNNTEARLKNGDFVVKSDTTKFIGSDGQKKVLIKDGKVSAELIDTKQMVAEKMRTKPDSTGLSINIFGGVFEVITKYGQRGISMEVDGNGFPHLIFYGADGRPKYDLGGDGLAQMTDGVIQARWSTIKLSQASTLNDLYPHTIHDIIYHEHTAAYNNATGTWGANAEYNDILFTDESFSSNRIADGIYTTAFDKNIDSLRPVNSEEALVAEDGEPQTKPTNESNRIYGKRVMRYHNGKMVAYAEVLFKINGNSASYCDKKGNPIQVESLDKYPSWQLVGGGEILN